MFREAGGSQQGYTWWCRWSTSWQHSADRSKDTRDDANDRPVDSTPSSTKSIRTKNPIDRSLSTVASTAPGAGSGPGKPRTRQERINPEMIGAWGLTGNMIIRLTSAGKTWRWLCHGCMLLSWCSDEDVLSNLLMSMLAKLPESSEENEVWGIWRVRKWRNSPHLSCRL